MEITTTTLGVNKSHVRIRTTSGNSFMIGLKSEIPNLKWVPTSYGCAFEIKTIAQFKLAREIEEWFWYVGYPVDFGKFVNLIEPSHEMILEWFATDPDLISSDLSDLLAEAQLTPQPRMRRAKPLVRFWYKGMLIVGVAHSRSVDGRVGIFQGKTANGLGGYVSYFEESEIIFSDDPPPASELTLRDRELQI